MKTPALAAIGLMLAGCAATQQPPSRLQRCDALLDGQVLAIAYSGYRRGQHPDLGEGERAPTDAQILEDLALIESLGVRLVRLYGAGDYARRTLTLIRRHRLPIRVLQGIWLRAERSNHEGCPWLDSPIPPDRLTANAVANREELARGIELANAFPDIIVAVNVGNEALVDWTDHLVPEQQVIAYVRKVRAAIAQPVTVAENYVWWRDSGRRLAAEIDFVGIHSYPVWEDKAVDEAIAYTALNVQQVRDAVGDVPVAVLEAGWPTRAYEFGDRAGEWQQRRYIDDLRRWAVRNCITSFVFEAFDEPWKGEPGRADDAEKHWGLFDVDRRPKSAAMLLRNISGRVENIAQSH